MSHTKGTWHYEIDTGEPRYREHCIRHENGLIAIVADCADALIEARKK